MVFVMRIWNPTDHGRMHLSSVSYPAFQATSVREDTIQNFLLKYDIPGISGIDTRALTKILREKGTMNGMHHNG